MSQDVDGELLLRAARGKLDSLDCKLGCDSQIPSARLGEQVQDLFPSILGHVDLDEAVVATEGMPQQNPFDLLVRETKYG